MKLKDIAIGETYVTRYGDQVVAVGKGWARNGGWSGDHFHDGGTQVAIARPPTNWRVEWSPDVCAAVVLTTVAEHEANEAAQKRQRDEKDRQRARLADEAASVEVHARALGIDGDVRTINDATYLRVTPEEMQLLRDLVKP